MPDRLWSSHPLNEVAAELSRRLTHIFLRDQTGRRPVFGGTAKFQEDPLWRDAVPFYEYFHGDNGAGIGCESPNRLDGIGGEADSADRGIGRHRVDGLLARATRGLSRNRGVSAP